MSKDKRKENKDKVKDQYREDRDDEKALQTGDKKLAGPNRPAT